jgi:hypothetical protein
VIWGDIASFDVPGTVPTHCILTSRFKRGQRVGFRMTAIDGGSGETENTRVLVAHLKYAGATIDIPMRWRRSGGSQRLSILDSPQKCGRASGSFRQTRRLERSATP